MAFNGKTKVYKNNNYEILILIKYIRFEFLKQNTKIRYSLIPYDIIFKNSKQKDELK